MNLALPILAAAVVLVLIAAFFSGVETVIISADKTHIQGLSRRGHRRAKLARRLLINMESLLGTTLVGTNLAIVTTTTLTEMLVIQFSPPGWESFLNTLLVTPVILVFAEFLPKSIGRAHANPLMLLSAQALLISQWALLPLVFLVSRFGSLLADLTGKSAARHRTFVTRDDLRAVAEMATEQGVLAKTTGNMLRTVFELEPKPVAAIMRRIDQAFLASAGMTVHELQKLAMDSGFTRFPVYENDRRNVIGVVDLRDVLYAVYGDAREASSGDGQRTIREFVQSETLKVTGEKTVGALLHDLRYRKSQMVVVRDAAGQGVGIVTIKDLVDALFADSVSAPAAPGATDRDHSSRHGAQTCRTS